MFKHLWPQICGGHCGQLGSTAAIYKITQNSDVTIEWGGGGVKGVIYVAFQGSSL